MWSRRDGGPRASRLAAVGAIAALIGILVGLLVGLRAWGYVHAQDPAPEPPVWLHLDRAVISGTARAGASLSATLRAGGGTGAARATVTGRADEKGGFELSLQGPDRQWPRILAGDVLWLDLAEGDPWVVPIPALDAVVDSEAGRVSGNAPPGAALALELYSPRTLGRQEPRLAEAETAAGADGRWALDREGWRDERGEPVDVALDPPRHGRLRWEGAGGLGFERTWAAIALTATLGKEFLDGTSGPWHEHRLSVAIEDGAGRSVGEGLVHLENASWSWTAELVDALGLWATVAGGDRVTVRDGAQEADWIVPHIEAAVGSEA